jgi:hypothetical protein
MIVVLYRPVNRIARQTIPACERSNTAIFNPAKAAILGCGPKRAIRIELKIRDTALTQPISGCVRGAELAIPEI